MGKLRKITGIYKITSPSGKVYIGQSINIRHRWTEHRHYGCKSSSKLYNSLKKYGSENHKFEILHECSVEELNEKECYYIELYQSVGKMGLNSKNGGKNPGTWPDDIKQKIKDNHWIKKENADIIKAKISKCNLGRKHTAETRAKVSAAGMGRKMSEKNKKIFLELRLGKKMPQETKDKISKSNTGKKRDPEVVKKIADKLRGRKMKPFSEEHKKKISESRIGIKMPEEYKVKKSLSMIGSKNHFYGKKHSEEIRKYISEKRKEVNKLKYSVGKYDLNGNLVQRYDNGHIVSAIFGKKGSWFSSMIRFHKNGLLKDGFIYKYLNHIPTQQ